MSDLTEYERQRLEHIRRNHEMLVRLGLVNVKPDRATEPTKGPPAQRRKTVKEIAPETLRRSARVRGATPDYTKEVIDTFGDELERRCEPGAKRKRGRVFADEPSDDDADSGDLVRGEILESTTAFLREAREALLQFVSSESGEAPVDARGWRAEAVRRWGDLAGGGQTAERDWEQYVRSRMSTPPPPSPHDLLQEYYAHDVWQLLCVCVLMSRVSSWDTKHRCISAFFGAYATPSDFFERVVNGGETVALRERINSLGLFDDRLKSLTAITRAFLLGADAFEVGLAPPHKVHGVGKFGVHSFLIFCRDQGATLKAEDAALTTFCNWRRKASRAASASEAAPAANRVND